MNGFSENKQIVATLVTGIHREELGFGRKVAAKVENNVVLVQIDKGLSHEKGFYENGFYYSAVHKEIYLQLHQQLRGKTNLVIDLHTGINESRYCADILSADTQLLRRMRSMLDATSQQRLSSSGDERLYQIIQPDDRRAQKELSFSCCHTIIPQKIWAASEYTYAGLEIYLHEPGEGSTADSDYAVELIHMLCLAFEKKDF